MNGYWLLYEENSIIPSSHIGTALISDVCNWHCEVSPSIHHPHRTLESPYNLVGIAEWQNLCFMVCALGIFSEREVGWVCG